MRSADETRELVRTRYAQTAQGASGCCETSAVEQVGCCGGVISADNLARTIGYADADLAAVPEGANLGLGCGNPQAIAALKPGETVLDLGSGAGFDCFLAARRVGPTGQVIGVDMTPEMISKARANAVAGQFTNVEFRLGEIEALPVADSSMDVIMSNCVINLSPEKARVFREAFRVLKPSGRLAISDVVATADMPEEVRNDLALLSGCVAGASRIEAVEAMLREAGFTGITIQTNEASRELIKEWAPGRGMEQYVVSAIIEAVKP